MRLPRQHPSTLRPLALVAAVAALAGWAPAVSAGGIGILTTAGTHADRVYSYNYDEETEEYNQVAPETQFNTNLGTGIELVLGDKDNKITGAFRAYYQSDSGMEDPEKGDTFNIRKKARPVGVINAGLQFGFLGSPDKIQMTAVANLGSGFLTTDFTEYILAEAGVGGTWMFARHMQLAGSVTGGMRYRKRFYSTATGYLGVRYLFD